MKKILLIASVLLLAAGCNYSPQAYNQTPVAQNTNPAVTPPPVQNTPAPTFATSTTAPKATTTPSVQATIVLKFSSSQAQGQYLTASNGKTLYTSSNDTLNTSNCTGVCAANWPAYTVVAGIKLGAASGITGKLGTIMRTDGTTQLTYNNKPLYFWINDAKAGDATGQGVGGFSVAKP